MRTPRLQLIHLEDRCQPANITWLGTGENGDWSRGENWDGGSAPGAADTALLAGLPAGRHPPVIPVGQNPSIANVQIHDSCNYDLTILGSLTTKGVLIQPDVPHGIVGSGSLNDRARFGSGTVKRLGNSAFSIGGGFAARGIAALR